MNGEPNKRGKGRAPKKGGQDLARNTYIQQIVTKFESEASSRAAVRPGAWTRSEGQSVDQPVLSTTPPADSIQQALPAAGETRNSTLDKVIPLLVTKEEEVQSKAFEGTVHPNREEEVAERRSEGSSHCDREEEIVETLL